LADLGVNLECLYANELGPDCDRDIPVFIGRFLLTNIWFWAFGAAIPRVDLPKGHVHVTFSKGQSGVSVVVYLVRGNG
jgi:hypothetical protein